MILVQICTCYSIGLLPKANGDHMVQDYSLVLHRSEKFCKVSEVDLCGLWAAYPKIPLFFVLVATTDIGFSSKWALRKDCKESDEVSESLET